MREKPANEKAVANLINYLNDFWLTIKSDVFHKDTPGKLQITHAVAKRTFADLKNLKIISITDDKINWLVGEPTRITALKILDYRLKKTKRTVHYPIPDFAAIGETLKTIGERLAQLALQNEQWLKRAKNSQSDETVISGVDARQQHLFEQQQQRQKDRFYIAGQIASGLYCENSMLMNNEGISGMNYHIIHATDDLLKKLYNEVPEENKS